MAVFAVSLSLRVQHGPEQIAFEHDSIDHRMLLLRRVRLLPDIGEGIIGIPRRLHRPRLEIFENILPDVIIPCKHGRHPLADDNRRKELGHGTGDRFQKAFIGAE